MSSTLEKIGEPSIWKLIPFLENPEVDEEIADVLLAMSLTLEKIGGRFVQQLVPFLENPAVNEEVADLLLIIGTTEAKEAGMNWAPWEVISEKDGVKMVTIWTGSFESSFYMDVTEVTVGQFKKFLKSSGCKPEDPIDWKAVYKYSSTDKHPMIYVTWHDATAYAKWSGKRLPTDSAWEYAARGGLVGKEFPWGDDEAVARDYANYSGTGGKDQWGDVHEPNFGTAPVGSFEPNGYGLYDMTGNVWEWCQDWYDEGKVLCGGSWVNTVDHVRVTSRVNGTLSNAWVYGFRCVSGFPAAQQ